MTEAQRKQYEEMKSKTTAKYVGKKYGRLVILDLDHIKNNHRYYKCRCECGNITIVGIGHLKKGATKSCGCLWEENKHEYRKNHGFANKERLYTVWKGIKNRCYTKTHIRYKDYGGRGIIICEDWKNNYLSFRTWAINNGYSDNLTIDRIDVNGNYEPSNCRWITKKNNNIIKEIVDI